MEELKQKIQESVKQEIYKKTFMESSQTASAVRRSIDLDENTFVTLSKGRETVVVANREGQFYIESKEGGQSQSRHVSERQAMTAISDMIEAGYSPPRTRAEAARQIAGSAFDAGLSLAAGWAVLGLIAQNSKGLLPFQRSTIHDVALKVWDIIGI